MDDQDDAEDEAASPKPPQQSMAMAYLPFEVITDILARLPVISLLRLRSVAKPWRSLIDSHRFIHLHIAKSSSDRSNATLLLRKNSRLFAADSDGVLPDSADAAAAERTHPLMCYGNEIQVLGLCNGLLCLCNVAEDIAIWNPATKTHRILPYLPSGKARGDPSASIRGPRVYGFGYDAVADDYKLVRISQYIGLDCVSYESEVRVFSVRSNEWKSLEDMPYALCYTKKMGVHVNGYLHWVVIRKIEMDAAGILVAFDCAAESFRELPLPEDEGVLSKWDQLDLAVFDGRLCFVAGYRDSGFDVWVMREYGLRESWTKVASLGEGFRPNKIVRPLMYSKSGLEILFEQDHRKLFWYELKSQRVKIFKIRGAPDMFEAFFCLNSLAPVSPSSRPCDRSNTGPSNDTNNERDNFLSEGFKLVL